MGVPAAASFSPELFAFLREQDDRGWFGAAGAGWEKAALTRLSRDTSPGDRRRIVRGKGFVAAAADGCAASSLAFPRTAQVSSPYPRFPRLALEPPF